MARSDINKILQDLQSDDGAVLYSFILGEQTEQEIELTFVALASNYSYEAKLVEAANIYMSEDIPTTIQPGGVSTNLTVRVPPMQGVWAPGLYNQHDVVEYNDAYYKLRLHTNYDSQTTPDLDPLWEEYVPNKVYVQFPSTLGANYTVKPSVETPTYGFFELSVSETAGAFPQTWKPVRGVVAFHFSPTAL
jgi:hypothetical protein